MVTFFTSDLHFGHHNIIEYTNRPFGDAEEMNDQLVFNWNNVVSSEDQVWVLGDVCLGKIDDTLKLVEVLNGNKTLVVGNHDRIFETKKRAEWIKRYRDAGFEKIIYGQHLLGVDGGVDSPQILLSHFPYEGDSKSSERFADHRPKNKGVRLLHGHTHGRWRKNGIMIDVGVDAWAGRPVSLETLLNLFDHDEKFVPKLPWV